MDRLYKSEIGSLLDCVGALEKELQEAKCWARTLRGAEGFDPSGYPGSIPGASILLATGGGQTWGFGERENSRTVYPL